jgi:hypothetical protein
MPRTFPSTDMVSSLLVATILTKVEPAQPFGGWAFGVLGRKGRGQQLIEALMGGS